MVASKRSVYTLLIFVGVFLLGSVSLVAQKSTDLLNRKITLSVVDGNVSAVLSDMASLSGCNIVLAVDLQSEKTDKKEEQKITVQLRDIPIEQALSLVVKTVGLSYRLIGENTFLVGEKKRIEEEVGERSYVVNLNNVDAAKIAKSLKSLPGDIQALEGQNSLIIRANPESFAEISKRLEEIDTPQQQVEIRARLIEVSVKDAKKFGIDWSRINHFTTILAEDPSDAIGNGLPYNYSPVEAGQLVPPAGELTDFEKLPEQQYFQKMDDFDDFFHFSRQLTAFDITLDWLLENNAAKLLTDTRLTAKNGEEADILIGEVVPFVVQDKEENQIQVEREEVGIKLKVRPTVNRDGMITTTISPEVSSVIELVGGYVPRVKKRLVNSTITVPNGSRIIVGGLLNSEMKEQTNKVPFLGDLPFIGRLFQHKYETLEVTDLIIEITPRLIDTTVPAEEYEIDDVMEQHLIKKAE